jgi:hypothetical protein
MYKEDLNVLDKQLYLVQEMLDGMEQHVLVKLKEHVFQDQLGMELLVSVSNLEPVHLDILNLEVHALVQQELFAHLVSLGTEDIV